LSNEKTEFRHSVSCTTEFKRNQGRPDGVFGSESIGMNATITVRFDDPKDAMEMLGNPELVEVVEKVRHIATTNVARNVQLEYLLDTEFETHESEPVHGEDAHKLDGDGEEKGPWKTECEECGNEYDRPYKPVSKEYRKSKYLCPPCYKKANPKSN